MKKDIRFRSKKFYPGTVHEIQGGKVRILDRYLTEEKDKDVIMLQYEYLETGEIVDNKQDNLAASIQKLKTMRLKAMENEGKQPPLDKDGMSTDDKTTIRTILLGLTNKLYEVTKNQREFMANTLDTKNHLSAIEKAVTDLKTSITQTNNFHKATMTQTDAMAILTNTNVNLSNELVQLHKIISEQQTTIESLRKQIEG